MTKAVIPLCLFPLWKEAPRRFGCYRNTVSPKTAIEAIAEARESLRDYTPTPEQRDAVEALIHTIDGEITAAILSGDTDLEPPRPH